MHRHPAMEGRRRIGVPPPVSGRPALCCLDGSHAGVAACGRVHDRLHGGHTSLNRRISLTPRAAPGGTVGSIPTADPIWEVRVRAIWRALTREPASFWLICTYLFFEYVRPQSIYPALSFLPWAQIMILGALAALLLEGGRIRLPTVASALYVGFVAIVLLSSLTAWNPSISWQKISLPLSWFLIYVVIVSIVNTEKRFFIFFLSFLLYNLKMSQHGARTWVGIGFGFQDWGATGAPGWFQNSGEFGIEMCIFLPVSVAFILALRHRWPRWKLALFTLMPVTAVMSMVASSSRGALIGGAVLLVWMILKTRYRVRGLVLAAVVAITVFAVIPPQQKERLRAMGEDETSVHRLTMWKDGIQIANRYPVLGIGYNNWGDFYKNYYDHGLPHNIFIEAWAELGYLGLGAFLALIVATFYVNWGTRRIARLMAERGRFLYFMAHGLDGALVGLLASGFFVTVLHYPFFWINLAMTVSLHLTARRAARARARVVGKPGARGQLSPSAAAGSGWTGRGIPLR